MRLKLLIDADMFAFIACSSATHEAEWESGISSYFADFEEVKANFTSRLASAIDTALEHHHYTGEYDILLCLSDRDSNFRRSVLPTYKAHRKGQKPLCYWRLVDWMQQEADVYLRPSLEADDCIGILATMEKNKEKCIIISGDKDMLTLPGYHYDFLRDTYEHISEEEADRNFFMQTLTGDPTDGYSGCPKVGKVTAERILEEDCSWEAVVRAYEKQGLTAEDALQQARVARILRASNYDFKKREVRLWTPSVHH
jgi:putative phage exonuclease